MVYSQRYVEFALCTVPDYAVGARRAFGRFGVVIDDIAGALLPWHDCFVIRKARDVCCRCMLQVYGAPTLSLPAAKASTKQ